MSRLRRSAGHISLQPVLVCTDHQSLRKWHTECVYSPSGPAAHVVRWPETFSKFNLSMVYVPGKGNPIADVLRRFVYPAGRALGDVSVQGDGKETGLAKRLNAFERHWEEGIIDLQVNCFSVGSKRAPTADMIRSSVACVFHLARPLAPSAPVFFSANNDVLTSVVFLSFSAVLPRQGRETTAGGKRI